MEHKSVLVVEDNELNMKLVRELLKIGDYSSIEAKDAETGLELARTHRPDLILMDIQLPGMDGLTAAKIIKNDPDLKTTPVIALTSYAMTGDDLKAKEAGCDGYITKPVDTKLFLKTIGRFLIAEKAPETQDSCQPAKRVLIVDDEPLNVKLLAAKLSQEPYEILTAFNGHEAMKKVSKDSPDLILLDIMMPGIDGYEITRTLKNDPDTRHIPIILVTALNGQEDKRRGLESGADEFLNKPVNSTELKARVRSLLELKDYQEQVISRNFSTADAGFPGVCGPSALRWVPEAAPEGWPNVLIVEDDEQDIRLFENYLQGQKVRLLIARTGEDAVLRIKEHRVDLVLLDIMLGGMDGFEVCRQLKENEITYNIQVVVVTSLSDLKSKIKGIELGADDFLIKPVNPLELSARVSALLKKKMYMDRLLGCYATALNAAQTDRLTGLYNYSYFKQFLDLEIKRCQRQKHPLSVIMIDIDDFGKYNHTYGSLEGDQVLRALARLIQKHVREIDVAARYGGGRYCLALPYTGFQDALKVGERIQSVVEKTFNPFQNPDCKAKITVSIGVSFFSETQHCSDDLIKISEDALLASKNHRNAPGASGMVEDRLS
jgi:two-component system cell cycle response regulator